MSVNLRHITRFPVRLCKPIAHQHVTVWSFATLQQFHSNKVASTGNLYFSTGVEQHTSNYALITGSGSNVQMVSLNSGGKMCYIKWEDKFQIEFHSIWLRHNCHCEACRHKNGQRLLDPASIPASIYIDSVSPEETSLKVKWNGLDHCHEGYIPYSYLRAHNYNVETMLARRQEVKCDTAAKKIPTVTFQEITTSENGLLKWIQQINEDGISIVLDVPLEDHQVAQVAQLVGPVATTIYGTTFDVKVTEDPINVAYSNVHIGLHMDLVYYESPPGLQLLHCLKFDACVEGGESIFLDAFTVADEFRILYPDLFHVLTTVPATFQKVHYDRDYPVHIMNQKPHIRLNHLDKSALNGCHCHTSGLYFPRHFLVPNLDLIEHLVQIVAIYWAPPFEGPLSVVGADVELYYRAYEMFAKTIKNSPHMLQHKLQPGQLVVFNNLRMLHGRGQFSPNGGMRHLKGCYVNIDVFKSMTQVLNNLIGDGRLAKRVGNQCWF